MKKLTVCSLLLCCIMFFVAGSAFAAKPTDDNGIYIGNGFPSGPHFNLNIHGKRLGFPCPACTLHDGQYDDGQCEYGKYVDEPDDVNGEYGNCVPNEDGILECEYVGTENGTHIWKYSNSLFIPENTVENIKILMETGKSGGRGKKNNDLVPDSLVVTDPCAFGDGEATFQLPPAENGYWVFFRALAKPTGDPSLTISNVGVNFFEDGDGHVSYYAGSVGATWLKSTSNGTFTRNNGKPKTVNVTDLFNFTGNICYLTPTDCPGYVNEVDPGDCFTTFLCCADLDGDGLFDVCELREDSEPDGDIDEFDLCLDKDLDGDYVVDDLEEVTGTCKTYTNEPIFNLADFLQFFMDVDNNGLKLLQVRFYPIPDDAV